MIFSITVRLFEVNFNFSLMGNDACTGYWDKDLNWHEGKFNPYGWMVEEVLKNG